MKFPESAVVKSSNLIYIVVKLRYLFSSSWLGILQAFAAYIGSSTVVKVVSNREAWKAGLMGLMLGSEGKHLA